VISFAMKGQRAKREKVSTRDLRVPTRAELLVNWWTGVDIRGAG